jgi:hypothetical protein
VHRENTAIFVCLNELRLIASVKLCADKRPISTDFRSNTAFSRLISRVYSAIVQSARRTEGAVFGDVLPLGVAEAKERLLVSAFLSGPSAIGVAQTENSVVARFFLAPFTLFGVRWGWYVV